MLPDLQSLPDASASGAAVPWAAAQAPDRIRSWVLISPFARDVKISPVMGALFWLMIHNPWHYPQTEMPEETAPIVIDFLRGAAHGAQD